MGNAGSCSKGDGPCCEVGCGRSAGFCCSVVPQVRVVPWGVLGTQSSGMRKAPAPDAATVILDPAGLPYIQRLGPGKAGGAAAAIYSFLGLNKEPEFPAPVREAVKQVTDAAFYSYGAKKSHPVIHVVGPDFREPAEQRKGEKGVRARLAAAYKNVLREFVKAGPEGALLRLLPVSGGIFAGPFASELPRLTFQALDDAFRSLSLSDRLAVLRKLGLADEEEDEDDAVTRKGGIEMCVFAEAEFQAFEEARKSVAPDEEDDEEEDEEEEDH